MSLRSRDRFSTTAGVHVLFFLFQLIVCVFFQGQLVAASFLLPTCGSWGSHSVGQALRQKPSPFEPPQQMFVLINYVQVPMPHPGLQKQNKKIKPSTNLNKRSEQNEINCILGAGVQHICLSRFSLKMLKTAGDCWLTAQTNLCLSGETLSLHAIPLVAGWS